MGLNYIQEHNDIDIMTNKQTNAIEKQKCKIEYFYNKNYNFPVVTFLFILKQS